MKDAQRGITSFVLRFAPQVWQDEAGEAHLQWRGQVRHVQGDEEVGFTDFAEAVAFMQRHLAQLASDSLADSQASQEKVAAESFKLWEQFASTYSGMMFAAMERAVKQSEAIQQQIDGAAEKVFQTWRAPASAEPAHIAEILSQLQAQVNALAHKVEKLEKAKHA
jgi:hypothetical protein